MHKFHKRKAVNFLWLLLAAVSLFCGCASQQLELTVDPGKEEAEESMNLPEDSGEDIKVLPMCSEDGVNYSFRTREKTNKVN